MDAQILHLKFNEQFIARELRSQVAISSTEDKLNPALNRLLNEIKDKRALDEIDNAEYCDVMEKIIDMIIYVRNIWDGRGERDLTYSYLYTLQQHLPIKAIFVLFMIVEKGIGSWRDIYEYVRYIDDPSSPFVKPILGLYNNQLEKDWIAYKAGLTGNISLAAKWVPRERKKHGYMYDYLVQMWCFKNPEYKAIMDSATTQYTKDLAFNKCKKMYRTMVSTLNGAKAKIIQEQNTSELVLRNITPLWRIVKSVALNKQTELMNKVWVERLKPLPKDYYVPLLDVSEPMYEKGGKPLYKAIIKACQYAYASHFGPNIIVFSHKPEWVSIADCTLEQIIQRIQSILFIPYNGLAEAIELVNSAAESANLSEYDMSQIQLKIITCQPEYEPAVCRFMCERIIV